MSPFEKGKITYTTFGLKPHSTKTVPYCVLALIKVPLLPLVKGTKQSSALEGLVKNPLTPLSTPKLNVSLFSLVNLA